jgi:hypothetical protein
MPRRKTLKDKIEERMARKAGDAAFLTREFAHLGGEDQVLRALRGLVREGRLVRLGYGVYGRAVKSSLSGKPMLYSPDGFIGAAREALDKLGVEWEPTEAERTYNEGLSTQVPVNPVVRVKGRFRRHLRYGSAELVIDQQETAGAQRDRSFEATLEKKPGLGYSAAMNKRAVIAALKRHQAELRSLGVVSVSLFGSTARDEATWRATIKVRLQRQSG